MLLKTVAHVTNQSRREGGGAGRQLSPGPKQIGDPKLEKYPKIEQGPIKIGASTRD